MNIAELQLEAYNEQDLEKFLSYYEDNVQVYMLQTGEVLTSGIESLEKTMKQAFSTSSTSYTTVLSSIVQGNLIVNQEQITGHEQGKIITTISIYETSPNDKISKLWFGGRKTQEM